MGIVVSIKSLAFTYQNAKEPSIRGINGEIGDGEFLMIMGHGGAGKSTLCCAMNGIVPRFYNGEYSGNVFIAGKQTTQYNPSDMAKRVGLVLQDFEAQLFSTNVELEIAFGLENIGLPSVEINRRIDRYLDLIGLNGMRKVDIYTLSGGQKQRLAIGSVIAMEPNVVVMDEPTTDLDPVGRQGVLSLAGLLRDGKRTLVMVDNEPDAAVGADKLWLMKDGEMTAQGVPGDYLKDEKLLVSCGVMPLQTISLFRRMNWQGDPLTVEAALELIQKNNLVQYRDRIIWTDSNVFSGNNFIIEAKDLGYRYPGASQDVLKDINFGIKRGEFVAILGQNGSGKTTLAKHFNRLLKPTSGELLVNGKQTTQYRQNELARLIGYVFQNPDNQIFASTVKEEVGFGLKVLGENAKVIEKNVAEALAVTGLEGYENMSPFVLSKGVRQRVAVASVLSVKPEAIILDEPTTGLDYQHQRGSLDMLKRLNKKGHTVVIITHSMWIAEEYADRCIVMKDGEIISDGKTRAVFADEDCLVRASLVPSPIVRLSNRLGTKAMNVDDMVKELSDESIHLQ